MSEQSDGASEPTWEVERQDIGAPVPQPMPPTPADPAGGYTHAVPAPPVPAYPEATPAPAPAVPQPVRRAPVNYQPAEAGWWLASDGLWYPPETSPNAQPENTPIVSGTGDGSQTVVVQVSQPAAAPPAPFVTGPPKSKVAAGLLGIFLGGLGVHRFYLGYSGLGVLMLLLSLLSFGILLPFVALWGFIEGVVILCGGMNRDKWGRSLQ